MAYVLNKKNSNSSGILLTINKNNGKPIRFQLTNTKTLFGIEKFYSNKLIKWTIEDVNYRELVDFEMELLKSINLYIEQNNLQIESLELVSKILTREKFPTMIQTILEGNSGEIIKHEAGYVVSYDSIKKGYNANVLLEVK